MMFITICRLKHWLSMKFIALLVVIAAFAQLQQVRLASKLPAAPAVVIRFEII